MHRILIVDDDKLARKGLISIVPWEKCGFLSKACLTKVWTYAKLSTVDCVGVTPDASHNGGSSSVVERQIVDLVVEGSNPFFHPRLSSEGKRS